MTATDASYRHEAFFYDTVDTYLDGATGFIREGLARDEPVLVLVARSRIEALRDALADDGERVMFADMEPLGGNPARIIPAWHEFVDTSGPRRAVRGIGEPIHAGLSPDQLVEAQLHERLLNLAFGEGTALRLLCPYGSGLDPAVLDEARHAHPFACDGRGPLVDRCDHDWTRTAPALVEPERVDVELPYDRGGLASLRDAVRDLAVSAGVPDERVESLVVAVSEIGTNSILHGGGHGVLRAWRAGRSLVFELHDAGWIADPLAGRRRPASRAVSGRGLWLANQFCDLVQLRTSPERGTTVRLHVVLDEQH